MNKISFSLSTYMWHSFSVLPTHFWLCFLKKKKILKWSQSSEEKKKLFLVVNLESCLFFWYDKKYGKMNQIWLWDQVYKIWFIGLPLPCNTFFICSMLTIMTFILQLCQNLILILVPFNPSYLFKTFKPWNKTLW